jgi:hypothetical protein
VLGDDGSGQDSWVLAGMQWAAVDAAAKIISMSLGSPDPTDGSDPLSAAAVPWPAGIPPATGRQRLAAQPASRRNAYGASWRR